MRAETRWRRGLSCRPRGGHLREESGRGGAAGERGALSPDRGEHGRRHLDARSRDPPFHLREPFRREAARLQRRRGAGAAVRGQHDAGFGASRQRAPCRSACRVRRRGPVGCDHHGGGRSADQGWWHRADRDRGQRAGRCERSPDQRSRGHTQYHRMEARPGGLAGERGAVSQPVRAITDRRLPHHARRGDPPREPCADHDARVPVPR